MRAHNYTCMPINIHEHVDRNELLKYKQSFYIIRKTLNILKNVRAHALTNFSSSQHYYNKATHIDTLRVRERKQMFYLKRKNIILQDKVSAKVQQKMQVQNYDVAVQRTLYKYFPPCQNKPIEDEAESNSTRILRLREDQIERLSQQLDSINNLYHKQIDSNKKLISQMEELNKSVRHGDAVESCIMHTRRIFPSQPLRYPILYLNNKIQEEKKNRQYVKRKLKFYQRYNRYKKNWKFNFSVLEREEETWEKSENEEDACLSILCLLKTELDMIDEENRKKKDDKKEKRIGNNANNFFKKIYESSYKRKKKNNLFETIYKKQFFSLYEKAFTESKPIKFEKKNMLTYELKSINKEDDKCNITHSDKRVDVKGNKFKNIHTAIKENVEKKNVIKSEYNGKKGKKWNNLTLNNIYFNENFDDNFDDDKSDYFGERGDLNGYKNTVMRGECCVDDGYPVEGCKRDIERAATACADRKNEGNNAGDYHAHLGKSHRSKE
ncbi:conserved Plasmodium protein, unknown function [Plasmodium ovale curtisi]|uniref:Uncharacterized protein n=1 Tax=Plasmodium ovale curtisi TaxID=864141 RepID=A0A1A8WCH7_PLAOA|nr:conserved Plasmodium protein, unknown function [Plasmodium ovale curtisi]